MRRGALDRFLRDLEAEVGPVAMKGNANEVAAFGRDSMTGAPENFTGPVLLPRSLTEVQGIVALAARSGVPIVPSGGRTGLSGGAIANAGEVVVSLHRMNQILSFEGDERLLSVQAGVTTQVVQEAARERGLLYPVDFASRGSSQIGGNIATNAGGIRVLRYGLTRDWVAGLKVVTGSGELLEFNRSLVKNATGYDFRHLFVGSEGSLGIVVEATLKLTDRMPRQQVMLLALDSKDAIMAVFAMARTSLKLSAFEFFTDRALEYVVAAGGRAPFASVAPCYVLAEFDEDEAAASSLFQMLSDAGLARDGALSQSGPQAAELWRLREGITDSISQYRPYKNDISVRIGRVPAFMAQADALFAREYPGFAIVWFGHIGDGNLHISILPPEGWTGEEFRSRCERVTHDLCRLLAKFEGSVSAEHGIGLLKRPYLHYTRPPAEIELMRQIKGVFDPAGIMNPGKLFPP